MIHKSELKGKYIAYKDKDGKYRVNKVVRVNSGYVTIKNAVGVKHRVRYNKIIGRQFPKRGIESIDWSRTKKDV